MKEHWLPGYFDPQGFLTTLLQQKARVDKVSIDTLAIDFRMIKPAAVSTVKPEDGCLMRGLWLEGAKWQFIEETSENKDIVTLQDQVESYGQSIYMQMPYFLLKVVTQDDFDARYNNDRYFHCPVYNTGLRERLERGNGGELFDDGIVTKVPLYIG